jgi:hypothetical protein
LWALFATALDPRIHSLVADRALISYRSLAQTDRYLHHTGVFIRGVLKRFDLPQVAGAIAPRPLTLFSPVDPMKRVVSSEVAEEAYRFATQAYREAGAPDALRIVLKGDADSVYTGRS